MKKQISAFFILLLMSIYLLSGCESPKINQKKQEQKTMGRYTERDVDTPSGGSWQKMFALKDGGYALYEEGKSPVLITADGSVRQVSNLWRNTAGITVETNCAVSMDGDMVLAYLPILSEKEYEELGDKIAPNAYLYVDSSGDKRALQPYGEGFSEDMWPDNMAFAPDGWLYISDSYGKVFRMNTESGEMYFLFQAENSIQEFCFYENIMLALDNAKAWLYDMSEEELLEGNPILDEFVVSHQSNGKSIALAVGREDGNVLYLGCSTGLYRYVWDGSLIEQMADGQLLPFGDSSLKLQSMQCLEKEEFRVFFQTNHMVELYFDETLPAKPDRTLHVYSLEENQRIRYASQLFQKEHADVFVRYETGIDGDNAVSREDAQRKLNTELLAGDGPDLMVLDGLDIEQYASKGVLKELDDVLRPYIEDKLLFENMVEGMRMTEDKAVYALPMTVWLPCWLSERKYLEGQENLWDIVDGLKKAREEHPTGALLALRSEEDLLKELIFTSLPAWTKEDGSLDTEMLQDFFEAALCLWELNAQGMTEEDWKLLQTELSEKEGYRYPSFMCAAASGIFERWGDEHIWVQLGHIYNPGHCLSSLHFYSNTSMKEWMKADKGNGELLV